MSYFDEIHEIAADNYGLITFRSMTTSPPVGQTASFPVQVNGAAISSISTIASTIA
jgi:hypothetical protein